MANLQKRSAVDSADFIRARKEYGSVAWIIFKGGGIANFYIAWKDGKPVGTIVCSQEKDGHENMFGFFECFDDYAVAEALFKQAEAWTREHHLTSIIGTYNLDREDCRGILIEGRDRPAAVAVRL